MRQISLCIPHYNRFHMLLECVAQVLEDERVADIVISDDCSTDGSYEKLLDRFRLSSKVRVVRNHTNRDCYLNKQAAMSAGKMEWAVLFDDDNTLTKAYIDRIYSFPEWEENTIYAPDWAEPHFNYTAFGGVRANLHNIGRYMTLKHFPTALNTCNYFVNRQAWLSVFDDSLNPQTADSIFQVYNWIRSGREFFIVPGLRYHHRVHEGSHYKKNVHKTGCLADEIKKRMTSLKWTPILQSEIPPPPPAYYRRGYRQRR